MTDQLPEPLTPSDVDLRGFEFMPLFGDRLFKSETWIGASPEAKVAALRLWWHSYAHEVPAGSLPDDDTLLSDYAGYGVAIKAWKKIKAQAMRGYVLCSDGRLYHPIVAGFAMDGWKERVRNREKQRAWRERNQNKSGDITVTSTVTKAGMQPLRHAGEGEGQREVNKSTPLTPQGGKSKAMPVQFKTFIATCKAAGEKGIADYRPVFEYAEKVKMPLEFVQLAWFEFGRQCGDGGVMETKKQADWRKTFRNYVEKNYLKLWWLDSNGQYELTTLGKQAERANADRLAA